MNYRWSAVFILFTALLFAGSARAVDGTIDIDQAKVVAAGGFPYTITNSGSYRLTGNLTVSSFGQSAVNLNGHSNTTIDLNGFSITGPGSDVSTGIGIITNSSSKNVVVKNGIITGFMGGIEIGPDALVENVIASSNAILGISVNGGSIVRNCNANTGSAVGLWCNNSSGCTFIGNTVISNGTTGIECDKGGCLISGNTVISNGETGVSCGDSGCNILNNTINNNGLDGIFAKDASSSYGNNVLVGNGTFVSGGTSMGPGNTNLCNAGRC